MDPKEYANNVHLIVASGFVNAMIGIGQHLGLFEVLTSSSDALSAKDLALLCKLKDRYTEEWLGAMVASKIVFIDENGKYYIPKECRTSLGPVKVSPCVLLMGEMHKKTMECFKIDGQAGYDYQNMVSDMGEWLDSRLDWEAIVGDIMSYLSSAKGIDKVTTVLEVGCGLGKLSRLIVRQLRNVEYYAVDANPQYIKKAKMLAEMENIQNVSYLIHKAESLPGSWSLKFDWIIFYDVLHDLPHPKESMEQAKRVLKDDGIATIIDPKVHSHHGGNIGDVKVAGLGYSVSSFLCLPCSSSEIGSARNGIGWGEENKQAFLDENGWVVHDKRSLCDNNFEYMFTCGKQPLV